MIPASKAIEIILNHCHPTGIQETRIQDALGFFLAQDIVAGEDIPPFANAGMDGFAVNTNDQRTEFNVIGEVQAGSLFEGEIGSGQTVRIMTGAPLPRGADAVVEQEAVVVEGKTIRLSESIYKGKNIRQQGDDVKVGETIIPKGTRMGPAEMGLLASLGVSHVNVFRKPVVAILTTGNELVGVTETPGPGQIRNSNAYTLFAMLTYLGCETKILEPARDEEGSLKTSISEGLGYDVLITCGGVSVGKHDRVLEILKKAGVDIKFWKVNVKPGKPLAFGILQKGERSVPVFALPGNPVSAMVTFLEFVKPGLLKMMGSTSTDSLTITAELEENISKHDAKRHYLRGIVRNDLGRLVVRTTGTQSSGVLSSLVKANCLIILPEEKQHFVVGEKVEIELLKFDRSHL